MKRKMIITLLTTLLFLSWIMVTRADEFNQKSYVESVMTILRIHADAISNLSTQKIKYSDNLVRHAVALQRTFGLLGPMDWHAADSVKLMNKNASNLGMDEEKFEKLERRSRDDLKALVIAAHDAMEEDNRDGLKEALENMKDSCNACHAYLPESVAPDVWGTLKRK
jgi:cytochrome c556